MDNNSKYKNLNKNELLEELERVKKARVKYSNKVSQNIGNRIIKNNELNKINSQELLMQNNYQHILLGMFNGIVEIAEQNLRSNSEVLTIIHDTTKFYSEQLKENGSNMSESERMFIYDKIYALNELAFKKDSENKQFLLNIAGIFFTSLAVYLLSQNSDSDEI